MYIYVSFPGGASAENPPASAGDIRDMRLIPGSGRSPGGGHGNPLQYSCPWTEEPGGLQSTGSERVGHTEVTSHGRRHMCVVVVQSLSHVQLFATPRTAARQASLFFTVSRRLFKLMPIESRMPSNHLILCHPLLLLCIYN